ncbi:MAG TPA: TonB-dependent receptor [Steroidobacteraceae bacterium]|jgi:iron complex outermembrane receptor protein
MSSSKAQQLSLRLAIAMLCASATAHAAVTTAPTDSSASSSEGLEEVIVTGTRQTGVKAADSAAPIQVLSAETLATVSGKPDLIEALASIVPSLTAQAFGGDQANQTLQARLRGLSPNHVLVLVDGKRRHTTGNLAVLQGAYQGGAGADLNFIPVDSIDHIEVLTDGAAAQYGTDAIAGVINIILKKNSSGGSLSATHGAYYLGDGSNNDVSGNIGFEPADGAYLNLTAEVRNHGHSNRGGIDPRVIDPAIIDPASGGTYPQTNMPYAPGYPYLNQIQGDAVVHLKIASLAAGFKLNDAAEVYAAATYGDKDAHSYENYRVPNKVSYTDPVTGETSYQYPYGFNPEEAIEEKDYQVTGGVKGTLAGWNWDISSTYGLDKIDIYTTGSANAGIYAATGASPTSFYDGLFKAGQWTSNVDVTHDIDVGLAGPLNVAFGGEYRRESYEIGAGNPASYILGGAQSYPGFTPTDASNHSRKNYAGYIDLAVKPLDGWVVDIAGRHEHYSDFGSTTVEKFTTRYDFSPEFALRGTASTGFRAPTLAEEYYSTTNVGPTTAFVQLPPNAPAASILGLGSGLQPEKSHNYSVGIVFRPLPNMSMTLDAFQISIANRIVGSGTIYGTSKGNTVSSVVTSAIIANGNVLDPDVLATGSTGVNIFTNGIDTRTRGVDFVFDYPVDYGWGSVDYTVGATYSKTEVTQIRDTPAALAGQSLFDATAISDLETANPQYVINLGGLLKVGKASVSLHEVIYGKSSEYDSDFGDGGVTATNPTGNPVYYNTTIGVTAITNLDIGYQATEHLKLTVGAVNLFDRYPNKVNSTLLATYRAADDNSAVGIYPSFSPFGINGGYYYIRGTYKF